MGRAVLEALWVARAMPIGDAAVRAVGRHFRRRAREQAAKDAAEAEALARARGVYRQRALVRDLFGNPFRKKGVVNDWRHAGGEAVALARVIYAEHSFADLPVLADALEEAGCTDTALLEHCRGPNEHARGCWALDEVLALR